MPTADAALLASPLLAGVPDDARLEILTHGPARAVEMGLTLFREGDPAEALHVVEQGRLKLTQVTAAGDEVIVRFVAPGDACAAIAVLDGRAYPFSAVAVERSRVRSWPRQRLAALMRRWPRLEANVLGLIGEHAREALDRFRELATDPVPRRIARALLRLARSGRATAEGVVVEGITHREVAEMAATTPYSVSRALSEWEAEGTVAARRGRVLIRSRERLAELAGMEYGAGS